MNRISSLRGETFGFRPFFVQFAKSIVTNCENKSPFHENKTPFWSNKTPIYFTKTASYFCEEFENKKSNSLKSMDNY